MVSFTRQPLYPRGKSTRYPLDRKLGGPQSQSERRGKEKILDRYSNYDPLVVQAVTSFYTDYTIHAIARLVEALCYKQEDRVRFSMR
jgi:hypothetical protein